MKRIFGAAAVVGIVIGASPVLAQAASNDANVDKNDGIADIIVTAQRRSENVQKAAVSIEVFSGDKLRAAGISSADDLTTLAAGVQIGGGTTPQIYVRGVGDFGVIASANPAVATSLDGVGISRPQAISGNFFDLERIELLKGPQGTLYGRNASGGALNLISVQPKYGEFSGYFDGEIGNYNLFSGEGAFNIPAGDQGAFRLSYQVVNRDGYLTDGTDDDKHQSIRLQSKFALTDRLTARTGFGYTHLGGLGTGVAIIPARPGQSAWTGTASPAGIANYQAAAVAQYDGALAAGCTPGPSGNCPVPPELIGAPDPSLLFQDVKTYFANAQIDYGLEGATLTVIPAYRRTTSKFALYPSFLYGPGVGGTNGETSDQYSLETRLARDEGPLKWIVGIYAYKETQSTDYLVLAGLIQRVRFSSDYSTSAIAGFGQATYSVSDTFRLTGGVRYTSDKRSFSNFRNDAISPTLTGNCLPPTYLPGDACNLIGATNYDSSKKFNRLTWKAGIEYDISDQSFLYADASTGFKAGGFNQAVDNVDTSKAWAFAPEQLTAFSVGVKNRFFNNAVQLNIEGFYWKYNDLQLSSLAIDGTGNISVVTQNAGAARMYGLNLDATLKLWKGGTLHGAVEYLDSKYTEFNFVQAAAYTSPGSNGCAITPSALPPGPAGPYLNINCTGNQLVRAPKWSGNFGFTQAFFMPNDSDVTFDVNVGFASSRFIGTDFIPAEFAKAYENISTSLTYNAPGEKWYMSIFGRNLTKATVYNGGGGGQSSFVTGFVSTSIGAPRTFGARMGLKF